MYDIDNVLLIPPILALAEKIGDIPLKALERMLTEGVKSPNTKILIEKKENDVRGFLYASIEGFRGEDVIFIQATYIRPEFPIIGYNLLVELKRWARERKIEKLVMITTRQSKAWRKKYRFKLRSYVYVHDIEEEK